MCIAVFYTLSASRHDIAGIVGIWDRVHTHTALSNCDDTVDGVDRVLCAV